MATLQKKWLRAVSFIALFFVIVGIGFVVKAEATKRASSKTKVANATSSKKHKQFAAYTFYYNGPSYSVSDVTNESNWVYDPDGNTCSGDNEQACTIQVDAAFVNNPATTPTLKTSTNLTATLNSTYNTAYVTGSSDAGMAISNAEHP
ncbi:hypothetical protein [Mucilaginibacter polytrichastri]|uniref:Uncharacterized protein n=1 Tax=Mucilaginibacter polytrichastri TaxID=1302689 RepID=A0A1Q5ZVU1_9SPHI|nr:hypothetical protein [Mucilaginibacter polytrichastri]OKS85894.1 hypothetical protein RG47T_1340 [Mucilaginibacter polytrichastri]SFS60743.1 hypothetical protein SAMN04487890_102240 [Mucilaginibacter polytrichastri]